MPRRPSLRCSRRAFGLGTALVLAISACTDGGDDGDGVPSTVIPTSTVSVEPRVDDGQLRLGLLLPTDAPLVAEAISSTAQRVVAEINAAGGVLGGDVELEIVDEGGSVTEATEVVIGLIESGVDAIIGPITSTNAVTAVDVASASDIVTCSPSATASLLDDVPDDMMFFRTIASDTTQAAAIAETADNTGARTVAVVHVDDAYGRPYASAVEEALDDRGLDRVGTVSFSQDDDLSVVVDEVRETQADVLIALGAGADLASFVSVLGASAPTAFDTVITNDAIRTAANQAVLAELDASLRDRIIGVAPQITDRRADADPAVFGPQVTDCVNLLALSTVQAGSDSPRLIAGQMPPVSSGGRLCRSFETCATLIESDRQIDYQGPTGLTELNRVGETARAWFERFTFGEDGTDLFSRDGLLQIAT